jgi:hypothetical protein
MARNYQKNVALLPATVITTAVTGTTGSVFSLDKDAKYLFLEANFVYGSGGTTAKFWVQTRTSGGVWRDIANFAFTTGSATKWSTINREIAVTAARTASDAALADDTILDGFLADEIRIKYTTTGTYGGSTTVTVKATIKT